MKMPRTDVFDKNANHYSLAVGVLIPLPATFSPFIGEVAPPVEKAVVFAGPNKSRSIKSSFSFEVMLIALEDCKNIQFYELAF